MPMKVIFVASPYAGDIKKNTKFAKEACRHVINEGHAFFVPHLRYPNLLWESEPAKRQDIRTTISSETPAMRMC